MPNVGIYLSDPFFERLNKLRDRGEPVNVSAVSQRALEREVELSESRSTEARRERVVARLRESRNPGERTRDLGVREGRNWAEQVGAWKDVQEVAEWSDLMLAFSHPPTTHEGFPNADGLLEEARVKEHGLLFWMGFRHGVREVIELVGPELEDGGY